LRDLLVLLRARAAALRNAILSVTTPKLIRAAVVAFIGVFLWMGLFGGFLGSMKFAERALGDPVDLQDLTGLLLGLFFMSLMLLLTFSNTVVSFGSLYRSPETMFLTSQPVTPGTLYGYKMMGSLAFASWASVVLGLPMLLAYGIALRCEGAYYAVMVLYLVPFIVIPAAAGAIIAMLLTLLFPRSRARALGVMMLAVLAVAAIAAIRVIVAERGEIPFSTVWSQKVLGQFRFVQSPLLPSYWAAAGLAAAGRGETREWVYHLALMASTAFFLVMTGQFLAVRLYPQSWDAAHSGLARARYPARAWTDRVVGRLSGTLGPWPVFVHKDLRTFLRDPAQWSQGVIFFGLLAVYIANIRNLNYDLESAFYRNLIATLNLLAVSLTLATMTTRFAFPMVSLEGRSFWVLGLLPVARWRILAAKFGFAAVGSLVVTQALILLSNRVLALPVKITVTQMILGGAMALGLSGIAVGMGAVFPNFKARTPSEVVSGLGGTLTLVASLFFVLAIVIPEAIIRHKYMVRRFIGPEEFGRQMTWMLIIGAGLAMACVAGPLVLGTRSLSRQEF